ncbi:hypothetical protein C7S15_7819 [Burkholderia cepacia]|nr:hypothetical protein [Burkholderia cepacia]
MRTDSKYKFRKDFGTGYASQFLSEWIMRRLFVGEIRQEHEHEPPGSDKPIV